VRRLLRWCLPTFVATLVVVSPGAAQGPLQSPGYRGLYNAFNRPTVTPYLNLTRPGNPAANYYMGVVPEFERREFEERSSDAINTLGREIGDRRVTDDPLFDPRQLIPRLPQTGHPVGYLNYGSYYNLPRSPGPYYSMPTGVPRR
jgi:hypothetical protein